MTKFTYTDPNGETHRRTSKTMTYTHCIVRRVSYVSIRRRIEASILNWERRINGGDYAAHPEAAKAASGYLAREREALAATPTEGAYYSVVSWSTSPVTAAKRAKADEFVAAVDR